jgi:hypothetical protein
VTDEGLSHRPAPTGQCAEEREQPGWHVNDSVEQFGAWSGTESVEACAESAFELTGVHGASS